MLLRNYLKNCLPAIVFMLFINSNSMAQIGMKPYQGHWEGLLTHPENFGINVAVKKLGTNVCIFQLSSGGKSIQKRFRLSATNFNIKVDSNLAVKGVIEDGQIRIFIRSVQWSYHLVLKRQPGNTYTGRWNILFVPNLKPKFYIDVENTDSAKYEAYIFLGDTRFSGFASGGLTLQADSVKFMDYRTGLKFKGKLFKNAITLQAEIAGLPISDVTIHRSVNDWDLTGGNPKTPFNSKVPADMQDGLPVNSLKAAGFDESYLKLMVDSINTNKITNTHSVLISRNGKLVYEQYFNGYDEATVHDLRSASKSISSAIVGIAMDKGLLKDTAQKLFEFLPAKYKYADSDARKRAISIGSLLTMSSGLDAIDFGIDRKSAASEDEYQNSADWLKTVVKAPMINYPGTHANYSSANPYLLGVIVATVVKRPLDLFIDQNLFEPLGISNYIVFDDPLNRPYFGGGMLLRPRDLLKFGLLYADCGKWKNRQIISKNWVDASFKKYLVLENHNEKNEYGFLWWHYHYKVNGKTINTIEARGAGGQYIFIVPEYQMVVVITSGNFRNRRVWQPEKIMENYILKAVAVE